MKVFITVDTEIWPGIPGWPHTPLAANHDASRAIDWYLYGGRGGSARGIPYQLAVLARTGLKATYFIDPMFSFAVGLEPLRRLVATVLEAGQEIGLHLHPEWLTDPGCARFPRFAGPLLNGYGEADQLALVRVGLDRLAEAGSPKVKAFRAGSWGANRATLRALRANGVAYDTSLNARFGASFPDLDRELREGATQPFVIEGITEFPVTNFTDRPPSGRRPLHVCAASLAEFRAVLDHASASGWEAIVIVLHSFEFVRVERIGWSVDAAPQRLLARRFERLCAYIASDRDRFEACHFADVRDDLPEARSHPPLPCSTRARTVVRQLEQLASRIL